MGLLSACGVLLISSAAEADNEEPFPAKPYKGVAALSDELRIVRDRWLDLNTLRAANPDLPSTRVAVDGITRSAARLVETQILDEADPDYGSWGQISGLRDRAISYHGGYFGKPHALARAYACPHSGLYRSPEVLKALNASLRFGAKYFHTEMERPDNWWAWDIGAPMNINSALLLAGDDIDPALRTNYMEALYFEGNHPRGLGFSKAGTGATAIWIAYNALKLALLAGDEPLMQCANGIYSTTARVKGPKGDGIMPDGSFHQHGNGINFGYGSSMLGDMSVYMYITEGTPFALPAENRDAMVRFFRDYAVWDAYKRKYNPYSSGRAATRRGAYTNQAKAVARAAVFFLNAGIEDARAAALATLRDYTGGDAQQALGLVPALAGSTTNHLDAIASAKPLSGVRALPYSDMIVSRSADHFFSVRLACDTKGWFSIANENLKAWQVGEGSVVMMTDGKEQEQDTTINQPWDGLMGVTFFDRMKRPREAMAQSRLTGCASTRSAGVIAGDYELSEDGKGLTGRKAYFLLDNMLVMLGHNLRSHWPEDTVTTTLYTSPVRGDGPALLNGAAVPVSELKADMDAGDWLWYRGSGIVILQGEARAYAQTLQTPYKSVNARVSGDKVFENTYLRVETTDSSHGALIVAGVDEQTFKGMVAKPPIRAVCNNDDQQAVMAADASCGMVAAHAAGTTEAGGCSQPGVLVWQSSGDEVEIVLSQRNGEKGEARVSLPCTVETVSEGGIVSRDEGGTTLRLNMPGGYVVEKRIKARIKP